MTNNVKWRTVKYHALENVWVKFFYLYREHIALGCSILMQFKLELADGNVYQNINWNFIVLHWEVDYEEMKYRHIMLHSINKTHFLMQETRYKTIYLNWLFPPKKISADYNSCRLFNNKHRVDFVSFNYRKISLSHL